MFPLQSIPVLARMTVKLNDQIKISQIKQGASAVSCTVVSLQTMEKAFETLYVNIYIFIKLYIYCMYVCICSCVRDYQRWWFSSQLQKSLLKSEAVAYHQARHPPLGGQVLITLDSPSKL